MPIPGTFFNPQCHSSVLPVEKEQHNLGVTQWKEMKEKMALGVNSTIQLLSFILSQ